MPLFSTFVCVSIHRSHNHFPVPAELMQLVEPDQVEFERWWLAAEGPEYPLQIKYQALFQEV